MKKTKILLLNPPYKEAIIRDNYCCFTSKSGYLWPPIDLLYLSGILKDKEIDLKVLDAIAEKKSEEAVMTFINKFAPEVIIALTGTVSYKQDLLLLSKIKKRKIYLIGNTPTFNPSYFLKNYGFITGIIHNFFDNRIKDFLFKKNLECESISYRENKNKFKIGKINYLKPLTEVILPNPPQYHLFPLKNYSTPFIQEKPMVTAMTSFGCPFHCKFCVASALNYYPRTIKDLEEEFDAMKKNQIKEIFFEDSTFNAYLPFTRKICQLLIRKKYKFSWSANVHSFNLNEEILLLMKKAGCHTIQVGIESGNQETLNLYAPSKRLEKIKEVIKLAKRVGLRTLGYFIIGFPNENQVMTKNTIEKAVKLDPDFVSFSVLTPDYGTALYKEAIEKKLIKNKLFSFDSSGNAVLENKYLSKKDQENLIKEAYFRFYLRPKKLIHYLTQYFKRIDLLLVNGFNLIRKKLLSKK